MYVEMLRGKIHRATVTEADLHYVGSLTLDPELYEAAGFLVNEKVLVVNINNGARFDTYIIEGERGSGTVCLNGPAARQGQVGDIIIAMTFRMMDEETAKTFRPKTVHVDENNRVVSVVDS